MSVWRDQIGRLKILSAGLRGIKTYYKDRKTTATTTEQRQRQKNFTVSLYLNKMSHLIFNRTDSQNRFLVTENLQLLKEILMPPSLFY